MEGYVVDVATDACYLINFLAVDRLGLLVLLPQYRFYVPLEVELEVMRPVEAQRLGEALDAGNLNRVEITDPAEMEAHFSLRTKGLGSGETACLVVASARGWSVASDERGPFRKLALDQIGEGRIITTRGTLDLLVGRGLLSGTEARAIAEELRNRHRFAMVVPGAW